MIYERHNIEVKTNGKTDYQATLDVYVPDMHTTKTEKNKRKAVLICPGGGYHVTCSYEGEPMALEFVAKGMAAFVLNYSVAPAEFPQSLCEAAEAMAFIRQNADKWHINKDKIAVSGFSAGGHLAASLALLYDSDEVKKNLKINTDLCRPDGMILSYPVIMYGKYMHEGSFKNLLGKNYSPENAEKLSLEGRITKNAPPAFIWSTTGDSSVPIQNSMVFAQKLMENGTSVELHVFPRGDHGLSLANEIIFNDMTTVPTENQIWIELAIRWLKNL